MKKKNIILIIPIIFFGIIMSCTDNDDREDECITNKTEYITSVNSPKTGIVNETINIEVNFGVSNGCGGFGKFIETQNGNNKTIEVEAKYEGCICTQDAPIRTVNYEFIANSVGDYELNFKSSSTEFITVNLTIN
ncbi:hypothetical protein BZARG_3032 [Bizionia argentinensis JUB59]|uniref:Lipoprotein n=1 Tax=Bizionia argentinensis JUB59 TaxID=1046627 RepID=G2EFE2_9FLAO|nr:hypothetical protein [Bizionia argentinensis]EGV42836.1 hypothetical protein BZARG_3032 [Bizionia argentinensis JUB59]